MSAIPGGKLNMFVAQSVAVLLQIGLMAVGLILLGRWLPETEIIGAAPSVEAGYALIALLMAGYLAVAAALAVPVRRIVAFMFYRDWMAFDPPKAKAAPKQKGAAKAHGKAEH